MTEETNGTPEGAPEDDTLPASAEETPEQQEEEAVETEAEEQPRKPTAKERIDELTKYRREAERERDYWKNVAIERQQSPQVQQPEVTESAPNPEAYDAGEFDTRYIRDLARWEAKQEVAQAIRTVEAKSEAQQIQAQFQARMEKAAENLPDFEEVVVHGAQRGEWACSPIVADALKASAKGPELAYSLASDPAEAARIYRLPPALQLMEIGKLEAKLATPKPRTTTAAPAPTPQVRGSGGKFAVQPDTNDFAAFDKQYGNGS